MAGELVPYQWLPATNPVTRVLPSATMALPGMKALGPGPTMSGIGAGAGIGTTHPLQAMVDQVLAGGASAQGAQAAASQGPMYGPPRPPIGPMHGPAMPPPLTGVRGMAQSLGARQVLPKLGGFKRAGVGLGVGIGADMLANAVDSNGGILNRTLKGAGQGAGLGLLSKNPLVIGGAALGGGVLGALGVLGGKEKKSGIDFKQVDTVMMQAGVREDERSGIRALYELEKEALGEDEAKAKLLQRMEMALQNNNVMAQQAMAEQQAQSRMLASQALAGQFFQPFAQQMVQSAQQRHQMLQNILPTLPENYRGIAASQSAAALDNATRMATAYQAQAQLIPTMSAIQDQTQQINGIASQMLQGGIQNALTGNYGQQASGGSLQEQLAALAAQG